MDPLLGWARRNRPAASIAAPSGVRRPETNPGGSLQKSGARMLARRRRHRSDRIEPRRVVLMQGERSVDFSLFGGAVKAAKSSDAMAPERRTRQVH